MTNDSSFNSLFVSLRANYRIVNAYRIVNVFAAKKLSVFLRAFYRIVNAFAAKKLKSCIIKPIRLK